MRFIFIFSFLILLDGVTFAQAFKGQTLRVLAFKDKHSRAVDKNLKEFEKLTGAKVTFDLIASASVAAKTGSDQAAGGTYDLYAVDEPYLPQLASFFIPVSQWPAPQVIAKEEIAMSQFLPAALAGGSFRKVSYGLPINGNVYLFTYRHDLINDTKERADFKKQFGYDLQAPKTTKHFHDIAKFFHRPPRMYGFAPFTKISEGATVEAVWILSTFGAEIIDSDLNIVLDEEKAVEAFTFYKRMMAYAPPGSGNWHHAERMKAYSRGQVAQMMTWPSFLADLENPSKSLVVGKTSYSLPPKNKQSAPVAGTWTLNIPKSSKNKPLAAEFAYWWASRTFGKKLVLEGMNPARRDLLSDKDLIAKNPWFPAILTNFEQAVVRPRFPEYKQVSDVIAQNFSKMVTNQLTPKESVKSLKSELQEIAARLRGS